jgi:hypothetical protein
LTNRQGGNSRLPALLVAVGLLAFTLFLILPNWQITNLSAFANTFQIPLAAINLVCLASGCIVGFSLNFALSRGKVSNQRKLEEWQAQDAKLAASLVSDKEKQLEAKIATLETALKNALKRQT